MFNKNGFFGKKKKTKNQKQTAEKFCTSIARTKVLAQSWAHGEGRKFAASIADSCACRMRRGASSGDGDGLSLPRGFYGSHHSSSPSATSYFFGAAEAAWKVVQKKMLNASPWCHWLRDNTPCLTGCSALHPSAHSCVCLFAYVKGITNPAHTHSRFLTIPNALSTCVVFKYTLKDTHRMDIDGKLLRVF